ncbi:MAG: GntR family transcriptional regulator [Bacillaceae bacterium]
MFELDFNSEKAIYTQLYEQIILAIARKDLLPGDSLPSVRAMAEEIGINLHTVNKTYNLLKEEGYVLIDRRKGACIQAVPISIKEEEQQDWQQQLQLLAAKAFIQGMSEEEFMKVCKKTYELYGGDSK